MSPYISNLFAIMEVRYHESSTFMRYVRYKLGPVGYRKLCTSCFTMISFVLHRLAMSWTTDKTHNMQQAIYDGGYLVSGGGQSEYTGTLFGKAEGVSWWLECLGRSQGQNQKCRRRRAFLAAGPFEALHSPWYPLRGKGPADFCGSAIYSGATLGGGIHQTSPIPKE